MPATDRKAVEQLSADSMALREPPLHAPQYQARPRRRALRASAGSRALHCAVTSSAGAAGQLPTACCEYAPYDTFANERRNDVISVDAGGWGIWAAGGYRAKAQVAAVALHH